MQRCLGGLLAAVLAFLAAEQVAATKPDRSLTVVYSGSLLGELEPCGCTREGDLGGIRRQASLLDALRAEQPELVLISAGGFFSTLLPTHRITNRFILTGLAELHYDAVGVQWGDLTYGSDVLSDASLPLVASNWLGAEFLRVRLLDRGGRKLAYYQWLPPEASPYRRMQGQHARVADAADGLAAALRQARAQGALTLLGASLSAGAAARLLPLGLVDVLVLPSKREQFGAPEQVGSTLVLRPGSRGQRLGRLDLTLADDGRIRRWEHNVLALPDTVADAPRMQPWYDGYTAALKQDYAQRLVRDRQTTGESPFLGSEGCIGCHGTIYAGWTGTEHAGAFASLEEVDKSFDANCIGCHTVGFGETGGFTDPESSGHLAGVGCEACHGPGRVHAESGGSRDFEADAGRGADACHRCHNRIHSPSFQFERYWSGVRHGPESGAQPSP